MTEPVKTPQRADDKSIRRHCEQRLGMLKSIRVDYEEEADHIARFAQPARSRFMRNMKDKTGHRRRRWNSTLFDPHGIEAFRTLTNGMTSGLSSASRPWFSLGMADESLKEQPGVGPWLSEVERRLYVFFASTNFYSAAKSGYGEMGLFGTEGCVMVEHPVVGAVCHALTFGEYWIGLSDALVPDTLYRTCPLSVKQAVEMFGDKVSRIVRGLYDKSQYDQPVEIWHAIEPDPDYDPSKFASKPWRSVYWEGGGDSQDALLKVSGYNEQPFWAPRWDVIGGDTYGTSPGMESLGALRELQMQTKRRNEAIDQLVKPEKIAPAGVKLTGMPGNVVTASNIDAGQFHIPYPMPYQAVEALGAEIDKCKQQIDALSFADLFNAITNMAGIQPRTVEEIAARNEEKLTQLGPVIERVANEKLQVAIDRSFAILDRMKLLPPVPPALQQAGGAHISVEFVSILQQMQRMVGLGQIERVTGYVGNLAAAHPEALDMIDFDQTIDEYAYRAGSPARMLRDADAVAQIRAQRAQQAQQQQATETLPAVKDGASAAQLLSQTDMGGGQNLMQKLAGSP
jgi:hypothetical protein